MRMRYAAVLAVVLCFCGLLLYGQSAKRGAGRSRGVSKNAPVLFIPTDSINVEMSLVRPPAYTTVSRKTKIGNNDIPDIFKYWMMNEISFSISYRPQKKSLPLPLENLKVELYIYAPGQARDGVSFRWFCGVQQLQCVVADPEQKQRKYWASLFLPSSYAYLHIPQERAKNSLQAVEGVVIIADKENNILGRKAFGYRGKLTPERMRILVNAATQLRGKKTKNQVMLWPREKTPWAWLDADRFEFPAIGEDADMKTSSARKKPNAPAGNEMKENEE